MDSKLSYIVFFIFSLLVISCSLKEKKSNSFVNTELWKSELQDCSGYRKRKVQNIDSIRADVYSLTEEELNKLLGRPEQTLLYERGQKFYEYKINCEEKEVEEYLRVRINALGYVNEVLLLEK